GGISVRGCSIDRLYNSHSREGRTRHDPVYFELVTLYSSQRMRRALLFFAAIPVFARGTQELTRPIGSTGMGWALADFDGDKTFDFATASPARHDARGYAQKVSVNYGGKRHSSFEFRSRSATVNLSALDIDGDLDHDLVVREPLSMKPIG